MFKDEIYNYAKNHLLELTGDNSIDVYFFDSIAKLISFQNSIDFHENKKILPLANLKYLPCILFVYYKTNYILSVFDFKDKVYEINASLNKYKEYEILDRLVISKFCRLANRQKDMPVLSLKETCVFRMLLEGMTVSETSRLFNVNVKTVYSHIYSIKNKSGVEKIRYQFIDGDS